MSSRKKHLTLKSALKNAFNLSPSWTNVAPKPPRVTCIKDLPIPSINPFEAFCDIPFDVPPETKSIESCKNVLQELERALQQIDDSDKIVYCALTLKKYPDGNVSSPEVSIKDTSSIPKFLSKLPKLFP